MPLDSPLTCRLCSIVTRPRGRFPCDDTSLRRAGSLVGNRSFRFRPLFGQAMTVFPLPPVRGQELDLESAHYSRGSQCFHLPRPCANLHIASTRRGGDARPLLSTQRMAGLFTATLSSTIQPTCATIQLLPGSARRRASFPAL